MSEDIAKNELEPDEAHITDDYGDLGLIARRDVQGLLERSFAVGVAMGRYDDGLTITFVSKIFAKNLGYDPEVAPEFCGRPLHDLLFDGEAKTVDALLAKKGGQAAADHVRLKDATGAPVFADLNKCDTVDDAGRACWVITARVAPEAETLSLVNDVFQTGTWSLSFDAAGTACGVCFGADLRRMTGYVDKDAFPDSMEACRSIIHPDDLALFDAGIEAVGKGGTGRLDMTYRARMANGRFAWVRSVGSASRRTDGSVSRAAGVTLNVDAAHRQELLTQELLREKTVKEELLAGLLRLVERYAVCDLAHDSYEFFKFDERMGYPARGVYAELLACMDERLHLADGDGSEGFSQVLSPERLRRELRYPSDVYRFDYGVNGTEKYLSIAILPLDFDEQGVTRVLLVSQDVTQSRKDEMRARQALSDAYGFANRANEAKTQFLSQMSHEIRTPLNGIVGMTALAAAHAENPDRVRDSLRKITISSRHLLSLINEVLDMSKIESGNISLAEEDFNLSELVESLVTMMQPQVDEKGHHLHVVLGDIRHEDVTGDALRLQQVFVNLMGNAVKYTPEGGEICLTINERPSNQGKFGLYEFVFEDNGIGMSKETVARVFEPFERARDERVERVRGAGLGMPISRNIVRMMGGDIKVESALDVGTRYTVTVFLRLQDKAVDVAPEQFVDLDVLVADDDPLALESCCDMLNSFGMRAQAATGGHVAVEMVIANHEQKRDFFACILDLKMPDMNGIECARAIRRAVGGDVPIIIISAYDWSEFEAEAREAGVNAFISKPLFRSRLLTTFEALVGEQGGDGAGGAAGLARTYEGKRVLVVEDNAISLEVARELLRLGKLEVECATDGEQAVRMVTEGEPGRYDLVLMDVMMPRMDGHAATRAIRAHGGDYCRDLPIVAMTANAFAEDVQAARDAGMNEHIAKPLDMAKLGAVLETYCG